MEESSHGSPIHDIEMSLDDQLILYITRVSRSELQWSAFSDYCNLAESVALWMGRANCIVIPKAALSEAALNELLKIVASRLRAA
jgi:hypothetical protein